MSVFPNLDIEAVVQVGDRTRLNAARSISNDSTNQIAKIEIQPAADAAWFDVTDLKFLDWEYALDGSMLVTVKVTTDDNLSKSATRMIQVISAADDNLFSDDSDLTAWEPRLFDYLPEGKSSFKSSHREAQTQILDWLDAHEIRGRDRQRLTAAAVVDTKEVREWSKFLTLQIIFEGISNAVDDVFSVKALKYASHAQTASQRASIKLDTNGDGKADESERVQSGSIGVSRE